MIVNKTIEIESEVLLEPFKLKFLNAVEDKDYFKPGIPYSGAMLVQTNNGTPAASVKVTICGAERQCPTFISDKNGIIRFTFNPINETIYSVDITAKVVDPLHKFHWLYRSVQTRLSLITWYSPSKSYIQIEPITEELECGKVQSVTIRYTAKEGDSFQFHHQILSRGRIVQQDSHPRRFYSKDDALLNHSSILLPNVREFALTFNLIASMSPIARLLVFYVREDGEIVADSKMFRTQKCWENKVKLGLYHPQQSQRNEDAKATVMLSASPSSICSVGLVDKRLQLFGEEERFSKDKLFKWLEKHDVSSSTEPRRLRENICELHYPVSGIRPHISLTLRNFEEFYNTFGFEDERADSVDAFERAGTMVISDLRLETRPCMNEIEKVTSEEREQSDSLEYGYFSSHRDMHLYGGISQQRLIFPREDVEELSDNKISGSTPISAEEIRSYFPETWLWELHTIDSKGETIVKRQLPHTITEWVGEAMCIHSNTGLGFSETSSIITFQPFFVSMQLPDSVIRYEIVPISVYVISHLTECLPIKIFLESSEDYKFTPEYPSYKMCVCNSDFHLFMVHFVSLGKVNITAYAFSIEDDEICGNKATARFSASDAIMKQLDVKAKEETYYSTCPKDVCGCILQGNNGNITSPSYPDRYPPNQNCVWEILAPPRFTVILNFTHFNLEGSSSDGCLYDKVEIHSRTSVENDQKLEGIYCGTDRPPVLRSKRNVLKITFKSDRAVQMRGFAAQFFTDLNECDSENGGCKQICRNTDGSYECACHSGFILHPNRHDCLDVNECATENGGCQHICENKPGSFQCSCRDGFELLPNERDCKDLNECAYDNGGCQHICENVVGSYLCSCHEGFSLLPNEHDCKKETCVHHMTSTEGVVSSPNYINYYPRRTACAWKFETAPGHRIKLVFEIFEVEADEDCVMLYIGNSSNSPLMDRFCGNSEPYEFISPSHTLFMSFQSPAATWKTRFQATYSSVCGGHLAAGEDPSFLYSHVKYGEQNYGNHVVCNWLITSSKIRRVWITFKTFDLEQDGDCEKDYIDIFDGFTETSSKLATFCGSEIPPDIHSTGDGILIRFHSNYAITGRGFALTYEEIFD
ncbi:alpha-2-macroglobulin-like isoform X2 [Stegodyphus dumicola]|nr:alpha-2-macroglobulin-like isoform X2 [Stegodyphus dumicola]XP_035206326.1 alpha-2-macroglobulin-like isoform X2 [Stegodyphus dumicola]